MKRTVALLLTLFISCVVAAYGQTLEGTLKDQYENKVLTLRHPLKADAQEYDSQGNPLTPAAEVPWTVYSRLRITKISLAHGNLRVEGVRVAAQYDPEQKKLVDVFKVVWERKDSPTPAGQKVELRVMSAPDSADALHSLWGRIFVLTVDDFVASVPRFWQRYIVQHTQVNDRGEVSFNAQAAVSPSALPKADDSAAEHIYRVGNGVTAPKVTDEPDPNYTEEARKAKLTGDCVFWIVVNKAGKVENVEVLRPIGWGLDESAAQTLGRWSFEPAK